MIINCVAIPDTLLENELFGYEKGAFTGAVHRRIGKIERVHGGTIYVDVRIIAATNRNLEKLISDGLFREEL